MHLYRELYKQWLYEPSLTNDLKSDLMLISCNDKEIKERFYTRLSFGTGGMRGLLGAGLNRINLFTIRLVAYALACYIEEKGSLAKNKGVVVAHDTRRFSKEFALETAKVLGYYDIHTYLFKESRPTPQLSFAIRELSAFAGVVITASHNPAEYNGFKVYGKDGGQLTPEAVEGINYYFNAVDNLFSIETIEENVLLKKGLVTYVLESIDEVYQEKLLSLQIQTDINREGLSIVYTPLHGAGLVPVLDGLKRHGFTKLEVVKEQVKQDVTFPTLINPNPEEPAAFDLAIATGQKNSADILIATDPDADRLGVAVLNEHKQYHLLTGNQLGALLLHYILEQRTMNGTLPTNGVVLKTIVTSELGRAITEKYGITIIDTLTGFKYISDKIEEFEQSGQYSFLFGYEESYGYLIGKFVRDKDAVQAALLTAEMAAYYKEQEKTLYQKLQDLFDEFGYYKETLESITQNGIEGQLEIQAVMTRLRNSPPKLILGINVEWIEDYKKKTRVSREGLVEKLDLPKADVVKFILEDGSWICVRPSGTEPKCKIYFGVCKHNEDKAVELLERLKNSFMEMISFLVKSEV